MKQPCKGTSREETTLNAKFESTPPTAGASSGTVGKALEVLDIFAAEGRALRFSDVQTHSAHPKATLYRFLQTLTAQGMLQFDEATGTYSLGLRLVRLAHAAWRQSALAPIARPHLDILARAVGETIHLAQMDRGQVIYVDKRNAHEPIEMFSSAGKVGPGYCTGVGKAMMAHLDGAALEQALSAQAYVGHTPTTLTSRAALTAELAEIRAHGVSYDRAEHEPGIICIAAPILAAHRVVGAVSVTTATTRCTLDELARFKPALLTCADNIGQDATNWQFPT